MTTISRRTCIHEAGHAVMSLLVGAKLESVSVIPRADSKGRTITDAPTPFGDTMVGVAGIIAEEIEFDGNEEPRGHDRALVQQNKGDVPWEEYECAARWMLQMHWKSVVRLADALAVRYLMTGDEVWELLKPMTPSIYERTKG